MIANGIAKMGLQSGPDKEGSSKLTFHEWGIEEKSQTLSMDQSHATAARGGGFCSGWSSS